MLAAVYGFSRHKIAHVLEEIVRSQHLIVEESDAVLFAAYQYGLGTADFSDLMIVAAAERTRAVTLYTFDVRLSRLAMAELLQ